MLTPACFIVLTLSPTVGTVWIDVPIAIMFNSVDFPLRSARRGVGVSSAGRGDNENAEVRDEEAGAGSRQRVCVDGSGRGGSYEFSMPTSTSSSFFTLNSRPSTPPLLLFVPSCAFLKAADPLPCARERVGAVSGMRTRRVEVEGGNLRSNEFPSTRV